MSIRTLFPDSRRRRLLVLALAGVSGGVSLVLGRLAPQSLVADSLMIAAAVMAGAEVAARAVASLRNRHVSIELLVTIAASGAIVIGEYWEAAAVTFLFVLGSVLEGAAMARTRKVIGDLLDLAPVRAIVVRDGAQLEVDPSAVEIDERVLVRPGDKMAVDGVVDSGASTVDEQSITGESVPRDIAAGDAVYAGTINESHAIWVRATGVGSDTTLARIIERVEEAQEARAPVQRFMDRFSAWYTPSIIVLAAGVLVVTGNIELALTVLVIACPGALVISTPISVVSGIGRAARSGILMKGGDYLERAGRIDTVVFDKTGTLTTGKPEVSKTVALTSAPQLPSEDEDARREAWSDEDRMLWWASVAEAGSAHPLAQALLRRSASLGAIPNDADTESHAGLGVTARYGGTTVVVGSPRMLESESTAVTISDAGRAAIEQLQNEGVTVATVAVGGVLVGLIGFADRIRSDAPAAIAALQASGVRTVLATGDSHQTAAAVAGVLGIDEVHAELLPEGKLELVQTLKSRGAVVAMVGDGVNDTPALTAADIGIAMGVAGSDIAIETADIALLTDDLNKVAEAAMLSRATLRNIYQNVAIALLTVGALLTGVLVGAVHMASGMLIHELSVLVVIINGMRLLGYRTTSGKAKGRRSDAQAMLQADAAA